MPPVTDAPPLSRRQAALALLAAAATLSACDRPDEEIVPYVEQPEQVVPGIPLRFATTLPLNGYGRGVLVTSFEGRPVKVEGNAAHPASGGATDVFAEAAVLSLYDPDRSRAVREGGRISSWEGFRTALRPHLRRLDATRGDGLRLLTGHVTSPTTLRLIAQLRARFPALRWHAHEPIGEENARAGAALAFGRPFAALPRLDRAAVALCLDADPLGPGPDQIRHARGFAARRQARRNGIARYSRLYAVEPAMTVTGAKADHRLAASPELVRRFAAALAARLEAGPAAPPAADTPPGPPGPGQPEPEASGPALPPAAQRFLEAVLADLLAHPGEALVLAGEWQPPEVHALAHRINARLGAPVEYREPVGPAEPPEALDALVDDLRAGRVDTLVVLGGNPGHDAPAALDFAGALRASGAFAVHLGPYGDETAALCRWHLPESHPLEDWADLRATDGTVSLAQPLIRPLHNTRSVPWLIGVLLGSDEWTARDAVRDTWAATRPAAGFEGWWRRVLHDGVVPDSAAPLVAAPALVPPASMPPAPVLPAPVPPTPTPPGPVPAAPGSSAAPAVSPAGEAMTLLLRPDASAWDGRFGNNAWLQECPRPLTRQVWGNAAQIAPEEARRLGLEDGEVVRLRLDDRSLEATLMLRPGTAPGVVVLPLGYGRRAAGAIGNGLGADAYALRRPEAPWIAAELVLERTGRRGELLRDRPEHRIEGEEHELFRTLRAAEFARRVADPPPEPERPPAFYASKESDTAAWAMVIDTSLCIGCNACVVACQSENNVPVVGPEEIARGRDMHWLRIDTYDPGPAEAPRPGFQPVPCMHCETAPCEPVCPVAASVHDAEGLNVQVYNRCIGTRFCQANCPYKVRHFNFRGYADGQEYANQGAPVLAAQRNPEVTVRARGVMEKCTYCTQRISAARRAAEREHRELREGEVNTACAAACPSRAIAFGDLRRDGSAVSAWRQEPGHYALLGHLGTRPRTTYLAEVRNPNPALDEGDA
ncbi:4Fe-4S dicluster domain-containing protein [Roseomonas sp. BN140053]|uniref:4Fe-4S dicluster domain-containing protein n=1 Tax=Roseomonas sp. BN140053 TaxID=3391898 RepID=UPI0039EB24AF